MNSFERYTAVLEGGAVDFPPRVPILMQFAAEFIGSDYGRFAADHAVLVEANIHCAETFGIDQLSCISDPYRETQGFGSLVEFVPDGPPRSTHPLAETTDLRVLAEPDPARSPRMVDRVRAVEAYRARCGRELSVLGWVEGPAAEAADLRGVGTFLMDLIEDEGFCAELMDRCVEVAIAFAEAQIAAGADTVGIGDAIASQVSPDIYERLIQPRQKRIVQAVGRAGARAKLHICGNITHLLGGIADLGIDILDVDHMVSLEAARRAVGPKVALTGNLDPVADILHGTPETIGEMLRRARDEADGPWMANAGCEIPAATPRENLAALCEPLT